MAKLAFNMYVADDSLPSGYVLLPEGSECPAEFGARLGGHCFVDEAEASVSPRPRRRRSTKAGE